MEAPSEIDGTDGTTSPWTAGYPPTRDLPARISREERARVLMTMLRSESPVDDDARNQSGGNNAERRRQTAAREDARSIAMFDE